MNDQYPLGDERLLPCPFCGHDTPEFERTGTGWQSCIVVCGMCGARHESSDEYERSGSSWNCRALPPADAAEMKRLADALESVAGDIEWTVGISGADIPRAAAALLRRMAGKQ